MKIKKTYENKCFNSNGGLTEVNINLHLEKCKLEMCYAI